MLYKKAIFELYTINTFHSMISWYRVCIQTNQHDNVGHDPRQCDDLDLSDLDLTSLLHVHYDLDVVDGEESALAVDGALEPVLVDAGGEGDDVTLLEAQLPFVLRLEVVQGLGTRLAAVLLTAATHCKHGGKELKSYRASAHGSLLFC